MFGGVGEEGGGWLGGKREEGVQNAALLAASDEEGVFRGGFYG